MDFPSRDQSGLGFKPFKVEYMSVHGKERKSVKNGNLQLFAKVKDYVLKIEKSQAVNQCYGLAMSVLASGIRKMYQNIPFQKLFIYGFGMFRNQFHWLIKSHQIAKN